MTEAAQQRYTAVAIALHWAIAIGIVGMIALGWTMTDMPEGPASFALFQLHKSIGVTIFLLTVARIVWRLMNPPPPEPAMPAWQRRLSGLVHLALYALMLALPLTGWIMVSAAPAGVATKLFGAIPWPHLPGLADLSFEAKKELHGPLEFVHSKLAWVVIAMLALHLAGALKHQFIDKDGLIARMAPGIFGRTSGPPAKGRGGIPAFGAALALFAVVAGASMLTRAPAAATPESTAAVEEEEPQAAQNSPAPTWTVDPASSIKFRGAYMGRPFEGHFPKWDAKIQFDPARPQDARIRVTVLMASVDAGDPYFTENVTQGDWFDVQKYPEAVFEVNEGVLKDSETQYEATGLLTIRGEKVPLRLPFTLNIEGNTAKMHSEITLKRLDLDIGRDTLAVAKGDEEWVQNDVAVVIDVIATRR